jgi:hypothetical protein
MDNNIVTKRKRTIKGPISSIDISLLIIGNNPKVMLKNNGRNSVFIKSPGASPYLEPYLINSKCPSSFLKTFPYSIIIITQNNINTMINDLKP